MKDSEDDKQVWDLLKADHTNAFRQLYRSHYKMVEYFILKNSGSQDDAQDVFQDAMIVIFDKSRDTGFALTCSLKTYIYSVVRNIWLKKLRGSKGHVNASDFEEYLNVQVDDEPEEDVAQMQKMKAAIENLGENCRKILVLFYYQQKNMMQIAAELGYTNPDNAKNQKYKCLQQLKSKLTGVNA
ncbi:MAG: sigma-70 family polymerase sigma factor [Bacteroidota bacterium]|nr:sigma-70 family polymerase sigma factor [Bacteroidota bacterium]